MRCVREKGGVKGEKMVRRGKKLVFLFIFFSFLPKVAHLLPQSASLLLWLSLETFPLAVLTQCLQSRPSPRIPSPLWCPGCPNLPCRALLHFITMPSKLWPARMMTPLQHAPQICHLWTAYQVRNSKIHKPKLSGNTVRMSVWGLPQMKMVRGENLWRIYSHGLVLRKVVAVPWIGATEVLLPTSFLCPSENV